METKSPTAADKPVQAVISPEQENASGRLSTGGSDNSSNFELPDFNISKTPAKKLDLKSYLNTDIDEDAKPPASRPRVDFENTRSDANTSSVFISSPSRYLSVPRMVADISSKSVISKESRPIKSDDLRKLRQAATSPLTHKFDTVPNDDTDAQIVLNYNLQMRIKEFRRRLETYDMLDVFMILQFESNQSIEPLISTSLSVTPLSTTIDLLDHWDSVSFDQVKAHVSFLRHYGRKWDLENLDWSLELLESSCEVNLSNKIQEKLLVLSPALESGPVYFFLVMQQLMSTSEDAILALILKIKNMNLTHFEGEKVPTATGQLSIAILRLQSVNKLPTEIQRHVLDVLQTSTVSKFNQFFAQLQVNLKQIPFFKLKLNEILEMADNKYYEMYQMGEWTSKSNKAAAFVNSTTPGDNPGQNSIKNWRRTPPADGSPTTITKNDRTYHWCGKCKLRNTTHNTNEHVPRSQLKSPEPEKLPASIKPPLNSDTTSSSNSTLTTRSTVPSNQTQPTPRVCLANYDISSLYRSRQMSFKSSFQKLSE